MLLIKEPGPALNFMESRPDVYTWAEDYYEGFYEADRDGMSGALTFRGMCAVMDEYGIVDPLERREVRILWRAMDSARRDRRDELKEEAPDG